tara:strand:- start:141 stop:965 length:825 start_codon:yes stop_codon:yes gene_type:complete
VFSQDTANYSAFKKQISNSDKNQSIGNSENLFKDFSISINYGYTQFDGDIRQYDYFSSVQTGLNYQDSDFKELRSAYSFSLEKKIDEKFSVSLDYVNGEFAGLRRPNEYEGYEIDIPYPDVFNAISAVNGQKFVTTFNEVDVLLNYDLSSNVAKLIKIELPENISLIAKFGIGYNSFRSLRTNLYSDEYIYGFGYEDMTKNESDEVRESVIIYGAKIKYELQDGLSLLADYSVRNSMSDTWDSSIMDGGNGGDRFSLFSFGLAYEFTKKVNVKN